jgi:hypothetical protein
MPGLFLDLPDVPEPSKKSAPRQERGRRSRPTPEPEFLDDEDNNADWA